uniref:cinnamyl-alcohol dehydrogenase n=1 Tax=Setaria italica TaxID=4555 RepID=K4AL15_SETIT
MKGLTQALMRRRPLSQLFNQQELLVHRKIQKSEVSDPVQRPQILPPYRSSSSQSGALRIPATASRRTRYPAACASRRVAEPAGAEGAGCFAPFTVHMASESGDGNCNAWAARYPSGVLSPYKFNRRSVQSSDVSLKITHCGVCYAVIWTRNKHNNSKYPLFPGHEIAGVVTEVGSDFFTFNCTDTDGTITKGGYSTHIVVHERYCFKIPDGYPLAKAAPLLCAGITVYTPMVQHNMNQPGKSLGVIGLGGLGHMAVKFGKAFCLKVTVFSTSESKRDEAINILGADNFVISLNTQQMEVQAYQIICTRKEQISRPLPFSLFCYLILIQMSIGGVMALVSFPSEIKIHPASLNLGNSLLIVGGTKDIQEMVNFCAANKIYPEIEIIKMDYINEALMRLLN